MKKIKWTLAALLTGELLVMRKKDSQFKKQLSKKSWREKVTYIAHKLFDFNKDLFEEWRRTVESTNFKAEFDQLKHKASDTLENIEDLTEKTKQELITDLQKQYTLLQKKAKEREIELDKKYWWKEKWNELKIIINKLKKELP